MDRKGKGKRGWRPEGQEQTFPGQEKGAPRGRGSTATPQGITVVWSGSVVVGAEIKGEEASRPIEGLSWRALQPAY